MTMKLTLLAVAAAAIAVVGCGPSSTTSGSSTGSGTSNASNLSGSLNIDGSTTVYPVAQILADDFGLANSGVKIAVGKAGTGSGFEKFVRGEIDICNASRPIKDEEIEKLKAANIEFIEIPIAYDGVSLIVNPSNDWAVDITADELTKAWAPGSTVKTWKDINPAWPADAITFVGPSDNHGTYEYFTEAITKKKNEIRDDYQPNQEYTSVITAVAGDKNAFGYTGYSYLAENSGKVKSVKVGGIEPTAETIEDGSYAPLSRPIFMYVSKKALERPEVKAFVEYALGDGQGAVEEAKYIKLPAEAYDKIKSNVATGKAGSLFQKVEPGERVVDVLNKG